MNAAIFTLWGISIAAQAALAILLLRRRLALLYWGVSAWALVGVASGLHLAYSYVAHSRYPWARWQPFCLAAMILLTADVAHKLARHWPTRAFGWVVNGVFGLLSLAAMAWVSRVLPDAAWGADLFLMRLSEQFTLACAITIGLNWLIYSIPLDEWRRNARRHVRMAFLLTAASGLAYLVGSSNKAYSVIAACNLTLTTVPICAAIGWARFSVAGERYKMERPQEGLLEALEEQDRRRIERLTDG